MIILLLLGIYRIVLSCHIHPYFSIIIYKITFATSLKSNLSINIKCLSLFVSLFVRSKLKNPWTDLPQILIGGTCNIYLYCCLNILEHPTDVRVRSEGYFLPFLETYSIASTCILTEQKWCWRAVSQWCWRAVSPIESDPQSKDDNASFTTVPLKALSDQAFIDISRPTGVHLNIRARPTFTVLLWIVLPICNY